MSPLPTPVRTALAGKAAVSPAQRALLGAVDGQRNIIALESVARAMGLCEGALDQLQQQGLIVWGGRSSSMAPSHCA